jgi:hypothetical protein
MLFRSAQEYDPSEEEKKNAGLMANNVRAVYVSSSAF